MTTRGTDLHLKHFEWLCTTSCFHLPLIEVFHYQGSQAVLRLQMKRVITDVQGCRRILTRY